MDKSSISIAVYVDRSTAEVTCGKGKWNRIFVVTHVYIHVDLTPRAYDTYGDSSEHLRFGIIRKYKYADYKRCNKC